MNEIVFSGQTSTKPTPKTAARLGLGIALSQTAYELNNGFRLQPGQPLRLIEDAAMISAQGAKPLQLDIPEGFVVAGTFNDPKSGMDAFLAVNERTGEVAIALAGTNGLGKDSADTKEDLLKLGVGQAEALYFNEKFIHALESIHSSLQDKGIRMQILVAGQSLGGGVAATLGLLLAYGSPSSSGGLFNRGLKVNPRDISIVSVNGFGSEYSAKLAGYTNEQIAQFKAEATLDRIVVRNIITGQFDLVSQLGGKFLGTDWILNVEASLAMGDIHRLNFGVAEGLDRVDGDLTRISSGEVPIVNHETFSRNAYLLDSTIPLANNAVSLSWASYVAMLFSKPGEGAASISAGLHHYAGFPKPLADAFGVIGEIVLRALPVTQAAQAMRFLLGGYVTGQLIGSSESSLPVFNVVAAFGPVPDGWIRQEVFAAESRVPAFVIDRNPDTLVEVIRRIDGRSVETHPDGTRIETHPEHGIAVIWADGKGMLYLKGVDATSGEFTSASVAIPPGALLDMKEDGWHMLKPLDPTLGKYESTMYAGTRASVSEIHFALDTDGKPTDKVLASRSLVHDLSGEHAPLPASTGFQQYAIRLGPGHVQFVLRDDDRRTIQTIDVVSDQWRTETTYRDGQGQVSKIITVEQVNADATRTSIRGIDGVPVESTVVQRFRRGSELFELEDHVDHTDGTRILTVRDSQGFIQKAERVALDATPSEYMDAVRDQLHDDVADFLTALRQKDTAGIILSTARIALDYARSQGAVTARYDTLVGDVASGLAMVQSLRSLQSGDTLAKVSGAVGLLNSTHYAAGRLTGSGYLSTAQSAALQQIGAVLAIANLANLGKMIEAGQVGSAGATVVSAINGIGYMTGASSALMGSGAIIAINPIVMVALAFAFDSLFGEDPPPPPPQGLATFVREADGRLGYRISESNSLGESILRRELNQLLPQLESQLADANSAIRDDKQRLQLIASRMPTVQISAWPSGEDNGVNNYFFVLVQQDPMRDDPGYLALSRLDLLKLYAETLLLPEALVQQWELDHLRAKFGNDESHWQTEGEWLRGRSPVERLRSQLQAGFEAATARWEAASKLSLTLVVGEALHGSRGNVALQAPVREAIDAARAAMEAARTAVDAFNIEHPLDPLQAARATPAQESDFARHRGAREVVALQWLTVLAVDFGGDGIQVVDLPGDVGHDLGSLRTQKVARFDVDGDGFREATQWVAPSDAILGIDRNGNGLIDNGSELFNGTDVPFDQRGLASLAFHDADGDGRITAADPVYRQLRLWVDLDGDGSAGQLETFDLQMRSAALGFADHAQQSLASLAIDAIDLQASAVVFADGQQAAVGQQDLLAHVEGVQIAIDTATANLNVLHENGLRENFITLVDDMSALQALQAPDLPAARRAELEALAARYGLNPKSADFAALVAGLRATGGALGSQETVIYFGDDDVWVDPALRDRFAELRISFRKLADPAAALEGAPQLARMGRTLAAQSVNGSGVFDDRWVPGRKVGAADIRSDAAPQPLAPEPSGERVAVPTDVTSLLFATKGVQQGSLVAQQAVVSGDPAGEGDKPAPVSLPEAVQPSATLTPIAIAASEDQAIALGFRQLIDDARLQLAATDPTLRLQLVWVSTASMGAVSIDEQASLLHFRPAANHTGEAGFRYLLASQHGQLFEGAVQVRLSAVNDAPLVAGETIASSEDVPLLIDPLALLANDRDIEGEGLAVTGIARVAMGRAELLGNGQIHYTPPSDMYDVTDTLDYIVRDSSGASSVARLRISLGAVDDAPTVVAERLIHAREDQQLRIASHLLLRNDIDLDADARLDARPLRLVAVGSSDHGSVQLGSDGQVVFTPDAHFNGEAGFSYTVMDETGLATTGRALIRFDAVNDAPQAAGERIAGREDERLSIDTALLLQNEIDTDIARGEPQRLSVAAVDEAIGGKVELRDGLVHFTPDADHAGTAGFRYLVADSHGGFSQASVEIMLAPVNDAPQPAALRLQTTEETALLLPASRLLDGATDVDGDASAIRLLGVGQAQGGTVTLVDGHLCFTPAADFAGLASFRYTLADEQGAESEGLAVVDVNNVNDAPVRVAGTRLEPVADEDQEIRIAESVLQQLFRDPDGDAVRFVPGSLASSDAGDRVQFDEVRRELVFRAAAHASGVRQIRFSVTDGQSVSDGHQIALQLRPVNDAPTVDAIGFQMLEDGGATDPTQSAWSYLSHELLLSGASDVDGDALSVVKLAGARTTGAQESQPVELLNDVAGRRIGIRAPRNYHGAIEFQFTVADGNGGETTQTAHGRVAPVNDVPLLTAEQTGSRRFGFWRRTVDTSTWQIAAWDPDELDRLTFANERNSLRGGAQLSGQSTAPDPRGGLLAVASIATQSGFGDTTTTETAWYSATDSAGAKSNISISFVGRYNRDPIVIDFDQDGMRFIDLEHSRAHIEVDSELRRSAWIGPDEGILAYDVDRDGAIRRQDEIAFGSHVGQPELSDLQALQQAAFDQNQDGVFDAADEKWRDFVVWRDRNGNGVSDEGELQSLDEAGVKALYLTANVLNRAEGADVRVRGYTRVLMGDGSLRQAADVWLRLDNPQGEEAPAASDPSMQQVSLLGSDQLASLLRQLAEAPRQGNRAPLIYGYLPTQHAEEGQPFRLAIAPNFFIDADAGDSLRIEATLADGKPLPDWLRFDGPRLSFEGVPQFADAGTLQLALNATDRDGASSRTTFTLVTSQQNRAPEVVRPLELIQWQTDTDFSTTLPASLFRDLNGDELLLTVTLADGQPLPDWLRFDPATQSLSGRIDALALTAPLSVAITATDAGGLSAKTMTRLIGGRIGTDGNDVLTGSRAADTLWGEAGDDTLIGGEGDDTLVGGTGSDVYEVGAGSGNDTIAEQAGDAGEVNVLRLGPGTTAQDVWLYRDDDSLYLSINEENAKLVTIRDFYKNPAWDAIARIEFADGEVWSDFRSGPVRWAKQLSRLDDRLSIGGSRNWLVYGMEGDDHISTGAGDDELYGGDGDDTLNGGAGADWLAGGSGRDTYRFDEGWGYDHINEKIGAAEPGAVIEFGEGIRSADLRLSRDFYNLYLRHRYSGDTVWVDAYSAMDYSRYRSAMVSEIRFADGEVLKPTEDSVPFEGGLHWHIGRFNGSSLSDQVYGGWSALEVYAGAGDDLLVGSWRNDRLFGEAGNDTLEGGAGDDLLDGGTGDDVYTLRSDVGRDVVSDAGGTDTLDFTELSGPGQLTLAKDGTNLLVSVKGLNSSVQLANFFDPGGGIATGTGIEWLRFGSGQEISAAILVGSMASASGALPGTTGGSSGLR